MKRHPCRGRLWRSDSPSLVQRQDAGIGAYFNTRNLFKLLQMHNLTRDGQDLALCWQLSTSVNLSVILLISKPHAIQP